MRQVLFVFGNQACVPGDPLQAARDLGCRTAVMGPRMPCGAPADLVDYFERVKMGSPGEAVNAATALHSYRPIQAVLCYDDQAVPVAARIAAALGLPGHPIEAADAARDKVLMKLRFQAAGLPIASFFLAADEDDAVGWAARQGYPVVVKPVRGSASQGVIRADDEPSLRQAYRRLRRIVRTYGLDTGDRTDAEQLVEGYLDGSEFSVEMLVQAGRPHVLCVFEKPEPLKGPFFEETIYVTPPTLPRDALSRIENLATRAAVALGLRDGAAHCEVRVSSSGAFVLEIGARIIGGACSRVFRQVLGEDIHRHLLRLALGEPLILPPQQPAAAGAMMLPIPREGRLTAVRNLTAAQAIPGVQDVIVNSSPGDAIVPFPEQSCYIGFLTANGPSPRAVAEALSRAAGLIQFELEPLECARWFRPIADHRTHRADPRHNIRNLGTCRADEAREVVLPIIASAHFGELPRGMAMEKARQCLTWLDEGNRGTTSPAEWLISEDIGVALGSSRGDTCFVSCLGVVPGHRRSGLGEALVRSIMSLYAGRGVSKMEALIDPRTPASAALFHRLGFAPEAIRGTACCSC